MLFSSLTFLFCFLPATVGLYYITPRKLRNIVLLLASIFFYAWGEIRYLPIIFITIGISYAGAIFIERFKHKKLWLTVFIFLDLSLLIYFKYANFVLENLNLIFHHNWSLKVVLPLGISFYTFQALSYLVDVYRGEVKAQNNFLENALYIMYLSISDFNIKRVFYIVLFSISISIFLFCMHLSDIKEKTNSVPVKKPFDEMIVLSRDDYHLNLTTRFLYPSTIIKIPKKSFRINRRLSVREYEKATVLPIEFYDWENPNNKGGVLDKDNIYIKESAHIIRFEKGYIPKNVKEIDDEVFYLGCYIKHWGHFLIECVTRLWPIAMYPEKYKNIKIVYVSDQKDRKIDGPYLELLQLLGIKSSQLYQVTTPTRYKKVIIPDMSNYIDGWFTNEYTQIFEAMLKNALSVPVKIPMHDKVFLSLRNWQKKEPRDIGLNEIEDFFKMNGFIAVSPEKFSVIEQLHLIHSAKEIVSPQGSIAHNLLFANPNCEITILNRSRNIDLRQLRIAEVRKLKKVTFLDTWGVSGPGETGGPFVYIPNALLYNWSVQHHFKNFPKIDRTKIYMEYIKHYFNKYEYINTAHPWQSKLTKEEYNDIKKYTFWP